MRKNFSLVIEGKNRDRVLDAVKHDVRKYVKRERRSVLPEGADYWDFDCRFGVTQAAAEVVHLSALIGLIDVVAREGGNQVYVEILAESGTAADTRGKRSAESRMPVRQSRTRVVRLAPGIPGACIFC